MVNKKNNKVLLVLIIYSFLVTLFLGLYVIKTNASEDNSSATNTSSKFKATKITPISKNELKSKNWQVIEKYSVDIDDDSEPESIELQANVSKDSHGKIIWNDGQRWALNVYDNGKVFPLFNRFLQLGEYHLFVGNNPMDKSVKLGILNVNDCGLSVESFSAEDGGKFFKNEDPKTVIDLNNLLYSGLSHPTN